MPAVRLGRAHGLKGQLVLELLLEDSALLTEHPLVDPSGKKWQITALKPHQHQFLAVIEGVDSREEAEGLRGQTLFLPEAVLPVLQEPESYYYQHLQGLSVHTPEGEVVGKVLACHHFGAGDVLELQLNEAGSTIEEMYPFNKETFPEVQTEQGFLVFVKPEDIWVQPEPNQSSPDA